MRERPNQIILTRSAGGWTAPATYTLAIAALVVAVLLRLLLDPVMGGALPLVTLFGAVAAAAWVGGYRPAILVAILGYVACAYLFIEPRGSFSVGDSRTYGRAGGVSVHLLSHHRVR